MKEEENIAARGAGAGVHLSRASAFAADDDGTGGARDVGCGVVAISDGDHDVERGRVEGRQAAEKRGERDRLVQRGDDDRHRGAGGRGRGRGRGGCRGRG